MSDKEPHNKKRDLAIDLDQTDGCKIQFYSHREVAAACHAVEGQSHD